MTRHMLQYAGYTKNGTAFSSGLKANLDYVDSAFARILSALNSSGNAPSTGLIISAKHGQQPMTANATLISPTPISTALVKQNIRYASSKDENEKRKTHARALAKRNRHAALSQVV